MERKTMTLRDRVQEFRRVSSVDLLDNAGNWRRHPLAQRQALAGLLQEVGIAGALTAYHSERNGGALTLIDGHLRKETAATEWPVLVLDVTDEEADKLLAVYDPLGAMAEADGEKLRALLADVETESEGLTGLLDGLRKTLTEAADTSGDSPAAPESFQEYGEDIPAAYQCPKCGYEWSGKPK